MQNEIIRINRGLDIPIDGAPNQSIQDGNAVTQVAILGDDFLGMKPTMLVGEGDTVKLGQPLFSCKKNHGVIYTSPAAGKVASIHRGERRKLLSVVIDIEGDDAVELETIEVAKIPATEPEKIREMIAKAGLWPAFRSRPFNKTPELDSKPLAIFINAMDTRPLAADPQVVINTQLDAFTAGCGMISRLCEGKIYLCTATDFRLPSIAATNVVHQCFDGPHPAGLTGTHISRLRPVDNDHVVWSLDYADVIAIGNTLRKGKLDVLRVISLAGPMVKKPRLIQTRVGASLEQLCENELNDGARRLISGSVLEGHMNTPKTRYLGFYNRQLTVIQEGEARKMLHWLNPFWNRFSFLRVFVSAFDRSKRFAMTSTRNGSPRSMVPIGSYESVLPYDILATPLLRALLVRDTDTAQKLGALELAEEDLALCSFVCHTKYEYGHVLRDNLDQIEKEG